MTNDVISKDPPIREEINVSPTLWERNGVWSNRCYPERLNTRDYDAGEHKGF
jgi:hypothetical protein